MRLQFATMTLALAILSRQIRQRSALVSAFQISSSTTTTRNNLRTLTTKDDTNTNSNSFNAVRRSHRNRPGHSGETLSQLMKEMEQRGSRLSMSAVEADQEVTNNDSDDLADLFPQKGKDILDCAPRMRFAPSPTGR